MKSRVISNSVYWSRVGESRSQLKSRKQRLFSTDNGWYFKTREGKDFGPYESQKHAENEINIYIRQIGFNLIRDDIPLS